MIQLNSNLTASTQQNLRNQRFGHVLRREAKFQNVKTDLKNEWEAKRSEDVDSSDKPHQRSHKCGHQILLVTSLLLIKTQICNAIFKYSRSNSFEFHEDLQAFRLDRSQHSSFRRAKIKIFVSACVSEKIKSFWKHWSILKVSNWDFLWREISQSLIF